MFKTVINYSTGQELELEYCGMGVAMDHFKDLRKQMDKSQIVTISLYRLTGAGRWELKHMEEK